jgi:septal ring factor EnvC (AmiA/AmiB activator)
MKAGGVGVNNLETIVGPKHEPRTVKKIRTTTLTQSHSRKTASDLSSVIERADQTAVRIGQKLQEMSKLLNQIGNEKSDIIRQQLARFFNVLKAYVEEALHPTGEWSTGQIMSGKSIKVNIGADGASIVVKGEKIITDNAEISELSTTPTNEDLETMQQNIKKVQFSVRKLRDNLASARAQIAHHSKESNSLTL